MKNTRINGREVKGRGHRLEVGDIVEVEFSGTVFAIEWVEKRIDGERFVGPCEPEDIVPEPASVGVSYEDVYDELPD